MMAKQTRKFSQKNLEYSFVTSHIVLGHFAQASLPHSLICLDSSLR